MVGKEIPRDSIQLRCGGAYIRGLVWGSFQEPSGHLLTKSPQCFRVTTCDESLLLIVDHSLIKHSETCIGQILPDVCDTSGPSSSREFTYVYEGLWTVADCRNQSLVAPCIPDKCKDGRVGS